MLPCSYPCPPVPVPVILGLVSNNSPGPAQPASQQVAATRARFRVAAPHGWVDGWCFRSMGPQLLRLHQRRREKRNVLELANELFNPRGLVGSCTSARGRRRRFNY